VSWIIRCASGHLTLHCDSKEEAEKMALAFDAQQPNRACGPHRVEPWTLAPWLERRESVSPVVGFLCSRLTDALSDEEYNAVVGPLAEKVLGTNTGTIFSTYNELRRHDICKERVYHVIAPFILREAGKREQADLLEAMPYTVLGGWALDPPVFSGTIRPPTKTEEEALKAARHLARIDEYGPPTESASAYALACASTCSTAYGLSYFGQSITGRSWSFKLAGEERVPRGNPEYIHVMKPYLRWTEEGRAWFKSVMIRLILDCCGVCGSTAWEEVNL
jgi:hypothetical protein